jgi:small subunit ribosomal protein S8
VVAREDISENLVCAGYVSEKWQIRVRYPELKKVVGKNKNMDTIADMINSINNAQAVCKEQIVVFPYSNFKFNVLQLLKDEGFILDVQKKGRLASRRIVVDLKYDESQVPAISKIKLVSKQGQRIYSKASEIKNVKSGYGISIISTSKGLLTNKEARKQKLGGEIICQLW